jgi:hypothetical protein
MRSMPFRLLTILIAGFALAVLGACGSADVDETTRDESGAVTEGGELGVQKLRVGDCVDLGESATREEGDVESFQAIPCEEPHQGEVFFVKDAFFEQATWPGEKAVGDAADKACVKAFEGYVGKAYDDSDLDFVSLFPTEDSWAFDDRGVACLVIQPTEDGQDVERVTGSLKG